MILTHFEVIAGGMAAIIVVLSTLAAGLRWIYRQGVSSAHLTGALDANTKATGKLSEAFDRFTEKTDGTLLDHEKRITRAEDQTAAADQRMAALERKVFP